MNDLDTYRARAAEAREAADAAVLDNVRERCLRSALAWEEMVERVERTAEMRATLERDKQRLAKASDVEPGPKS